MVAICLEKKAPGVAGLIAITLRVIAIKIWPRLARSASPRTRRWSTIAHDRTSRGKSDQEICKSMLRMSPDDCQTGEGSLTPCRGLTGAHEAGGAGWRSAAGHAAKAGTNTSRAGGLYPSDARRAARRRTLHSERGPNRHRELAAALQHDQAAATASPNIPPGPLSGGQSARAAAHPRIASTMSV